VHNVVPPETNATVPVAPAGRPLWVRVSDEPYTTDGEVTPAVSDVVALVTSKLVEADEPT
jgi:hypothetical protein